jgi:RNAse (barnase) inhibitor barstar
MKEIELDATLWRSRDDFYDALLPRLGAPTWHGRNLDALNDSIGSDNINAVRLPYAIRIFNSSNAPSEVRAYIESFAALIAGLRASGLEVGIRVEPGQGSLS